jgi:hypothetical protein
LKNDGKFWKASNAAAGTSSTLLLMATASITANNPGTFLRMGNYTTSGLTTGVIYYLSTAGGLTDTAPTATGTVTRIIGYATSTTVLSFDPDHTYVEHL